MCDHTYKVSEIWSFVQRSLFSWLESVVEEPLTEAHRLVVWVIETVRPEHCLPSGPRWGRVGAPEIDRTRIASAFLAKAVLNLPTTKALRERLQVDGALRRLCGWERRSDVPSESTFSRAFAAFAETRLLDRLHAALAERHLSTAVVWHLSRDATAIEGRERPNREKPSAEGSADSQTGETTVPNETMAADPRSPRLSPVKKAKRRRGRPRRGEVVPPPEPTRIERQRTQTAEAALGELPTACDVGTRKDAKGHLESWIGYKLHVDVTEHGLPSSAFTSSASLHDSQVAIPLDRTTRQRVGTIFYELMDAAYDAAGIRDEVREAGSTPIIDRNKRRGPQPPPMEPDRARQYQGRSAAERFNSDLKDNHGGRTVRVRGYAKVHCHLMFGVVVIFAKMLLSGVVMGVLP